MSASLHPLLVASDPNAVPIHPASPATLEAVLKRIGGTAAAFAKARRLEATPGAVHVLPTADGAVAAIILGIEDDEAGHRDPFLAGALPGALPPGTYRFAGPLRDPALAALGFLLGAYRFDRYRKPKEQAVRLVLPEGVDGAEVSRLAEGVRIGRDLVNTPTSDLGPAALEQAVRDLAARFGCEARSVVGDDLLEAGFPMVHAVGRAATDAPRIVEFSWGRPDAPKVTLVGKGVCFDTGGLNIKPDSAMLLMKKDMGGAAAALAAAFMIMDAGLNVRLRVIVPAVENAIAGNAFRPGDVLSSRKGLTVEIGNTDAEGRLILGDALALADEEAPDLLIDYATLTGAARVALGPDLPPFFTTDDALAADLERLGPAVADPVWRLPLWGPYDKLLASKIADVNHVSSGGHAGAITAALFLRRFVEKAASYAHFDVFAWVPSARPGRPEGGEAQAARLTYALVRERYGRA